MNAKLSLFAIAISLSSLLVVTNAEATNGKQALKTCSKRAGCISAGGGAGKNIDIVYGGKLIHCESLKSACTVH